MKRVYSLSLLLLILTACQSGSNIDIADQVDWESRKADITNFSGFVQGKTYLPVYSHIYHIHEHRTFDLTITASIRNISLTDTLYLLEADYYDTSGKNIRQYVKRPVFLKPMETIEIIISEEDGEGGSGANFVFGWAMEDDLNPPLFEAVMISTHGQQGLSFATRGVPVLE